LESNKNGAVWVNVDVPTQICMVHDLRCRHVPKSETGIKGIGRMLQNGGWFSFNDAEEALNYKNINHPNFYMTVCQSCFRHLYKTGVTTKIMNDIRNGYKKLQDVDNQQSVKVSISQLESTSANVDKFEFIGLNIYFGDFRTLNFAGQLKNCSNEQIRVFRVTITLFDELNRVLDFANGYLSSSSLSPNEKATFKVQFITPPQDFANYEITVSQV
jgi:hypothetical protein